MSQGCRPGPLVFIDSFPGRPNNPVGFENAPGFSGSLTPSSGPFTSGSPGSPTIISQKDFDAGVSGTNLDANWVNFNGCRFQSNNVAGNNLSTGGTGAQNINFLYCSFTPRTAFYTSPPGLVWPSAGAGQQTTTFVPDVNCVNGNKGYQFGFDFHNLTDGPILFDHCNFWGFGNAVNFIGHTAQVTFRDCWFHDAADAGPQVYHTDGPGYLNGGTPPQNILLDHCTIASIGTTNGLALQAATSAYQNIRIRRSFFSGFNVLMDICHGVTGSTGIEATDNVFGTDLPFVAFWLDGGTQTLMTTANGNLWRRNKMRWLPGTSSIASQQPPANAWTSADNGKFLLPDNTLSATDYAG